MQSISRNSSLATSSFWIISVILGVFVGSPINSSTTFTDVTPCRQELEEPNERAKVLS